jgi:RNA polymerase sigma factor (sigma-70 family)
MNTDEKPTPDQWLADAFQRYETPLLRYVGRILARYDLVQDVVQDAFVKLCQQDMGQQDMGHAEHSMETSIGAWLYRVCRNRALDIAKKEQRMKPMQTNTERPGTACDPAEIAERQDEVRTAFAALRTLTERQQEVVRLKLEHGLSYREIGAVLDLTASNVGYILHHSLQAIRQQLTAS